MTADGSAIVIRPFDSDEDCRACVALQREIWGFEIGEIVPATLVHVVGLVGGLAAGAFDDDGTLLGFVFGISGVRDGALVHWSHMLGVRESARNAGVGRMLKEYQRTALIRLGIEHIYWTFDPLQAKNAYFNIHRLGAQVDQYVPDMYGDTGSPLHLGLPTDRLMVHAHTRVHQAAATKHQSYAGVCIVSAFPSPDDQALELNGSSPARFLLEIPADVLAVTARSIDDARTWRLAVREQFQWAFDHHYAVTDVHRPSTGRTFYVMTKTPST